VECTFKNVFVIY